MSKPVMEECAIRAACICFVQALSMCTCLGHVSRLLW